MARVQTYVFIDLETTGLPKEELNKTRITELSMVAVKRQHLLDSRAGAVPRVQHKLTLCLNPRKLVSTDATKITGLCNDLLEFEPDFSSVFSMIDTFLSVLSQPVCLIAQNGQGFDFPILKNHLVKLKVNFKADVLCADCYHCFYHILEKKKLENQEISCKVVAENSTKEDSSLESSVITSATSSRECEQAKVDETDFNTSNISMKTINETTPKATRTIKNPPGISKARKKLRFPWGDNAKPTESYKLKNIYERVLNKQAFDAHRAENDCMFALEVSVALAKQFVEWVDVNCEKFSDVEPMTVGVPM